MNDESKIISWHELKGGRLREAWCQLLSLPFGLRTWREMRRDPNAYDFVER